MNFKIVKVDSEKKKDIFIKSQWNFYKNDKNWVPPIIFDRKKLLNIKKNPFYQHSEIQLFYAENNNGDVVGRIAAITNDNHNKTHNDNTGFFGFFECINNQNVADELFSYAESWLKEKGKNKVIGPENPSMNDEVGLLINAFDSPPVILSTYNPEYYINLIENSGYKKAKDLYAFKLTPSSYKTDKVQRLQAIIRERYNLTIRELDMKNKAQFMKDISTFKEIYNKAWVPNWGFVKWTDEEFNFIADDLKMIANPSLVIIAEVNSTPVGFGIAVPNINEYLIKNKKGSLLGALFLSMLYKNKIQSMRILALGLIPEYQKSGIDGVIYYELGERGVKAGFKWAEASWVLEDNEPMIKGLTISMNAERYKVYRLYEKDI
ncbi:MAG: hypothetical protein N2319_10960 [Candidatus Kapabacteria bacterium]|nr:hypothetical protein [Candidatus Kapabacteria bacterium]